MALGLLSCRPQITSRITNGKQAHSQVPQQTRSPSVLFVLPLQLHSCKSQPAQQGSTFAPGLMHCIP